MIQFPFAFLLVVSVQGQTQPTRVMQTESLFACLVHASFELRFDPTVERARCYPLYREMDA